MAYDDVTVVVRGGGQVEVNGVLVAEVAVGRVGTRDTLLAELTLHRISKVVLETIRETAAALAPGAAARETARVAKAALKERDATADGFADGLLDVTVPYPGRFGQSPPIEPRQDLPYRQGYALGRRLRILTAHLERAAAG